MKICPQCRTQFQDDMNFCLQDGTALAQMESYRDEKTLNLPSSSPNLPPTIAETQGYYEVGTHITDTQTNPPTVKIETPPTGRHDAEIVNAYAMHRQPQNSRSSVGILLGAALGGLLLLGTAIGGAIWFLQQEDKGSLAQANTNSSNAAPTPNNNANGDSGAQSDTSYELPANSSTTANNPLNPNAANSKIANSTVNAKPANTAANIVLKPTPTRDSPDVTGKRDDVYADDEPPPTPRPAPKTVAGGVVNGKATNLVKPAYPAAARAVRASGAVNVQVTIDERGNVISASAVSGHPLLRSSAEQAARASKFSPTTLSGQPVKVTGVIVYNFVP